MSDEGLDMGDIDDSDESNICDECGQPMWKCLCHPVDIIWPEPSEGKVLFWKQLNAQSAIINFKKD